MAVGAKFPRIKVFSDGASRGNPGPSAVSFMILSGNDEVLRQSSKFIGVGTNNEAEYEALIFALETASEFTDQEVACYMDSELVAKQLNGEYKVRNPVLKKLWLRVNSLKGMFRRVSFEHVPRVNVFLQQVDAMSNRTLDRFGKNLKMGR